MGPSWNCVRVVLGMGETNCNVGSNFDCNHSHNFCALVGGGSQFRGGLNLRLATCRARPRLWQREVVLLALKNRPALSLAKALQMLRAFGL